MMLSLWLLHVLVACYVDAAADLDPEDDDYVDVDDSDVLIMSLLTGSDISEGGWGSKPR